MTDGDAAPEAKVGSAPIQLVVKSQDQSEVQFKVKRNTKFIKVKMAFCSRKSLEPDSVRLVFDGERLIDEKCPEDLDMEDGDVIDCIMEQIGGQ